MINRLEKRAYCDGSGLAGNRKKLKLSFIAFRMRNCSAGLAAEPALKSPK